MKTHENDCSAVGNVKTTFAQTVVATTSQGQTVRTAFRAIISASHVERTTLAKHENDCSAVKKCETYFPDKLLSHYFTQQTLHFNFTDTLTPSPVRYSCVR